MVWSIRNVISFLLNVFMAVVAFFLGFRILFMLFGANPGTPFVAWIYDIAATFTYPFRGIFPNLDLAGSSTLDVVAIISLIAWSILTYIVMSVIDSATVTADEVGHDIRHGHV